VGRGPSWDYNNCRLVVNEGHHCSIITCGVFYFTRPLFVASSFLHTTTNAAETKEPSNRKCRIYQEESPASEKELQFLPRILHASGNPVAVPLQASRTCPPRPKPCLHFLLHSQATSHNLLQPQIRSRRTHQERPHHRRHRTGQIPCSKRRALRVCGRGVATGVYCRRWEG